MFVLFFIIIIILFSFFFVLFFCLRTKKKKKRETTAFSNCYQRGFASTIRIRRRQQQQQQRERKKELREGKKERKENLVDVLYTPSFPQCLCLAIFLNIYIFLQDAVVINTAGACSPEFIGFVIDIEMFRNNVQS